MPSEPSAAQRIAAALDHAERVARAANGERWSQYGSKPYEVYVDEDWGDQDAPYVAVPETEADGEHIALNDPAAVLRRCAADRRVLERHQPVNETVEWWDCSDSTGMATVCACCSNREPNEWDLGVGNYSAKPEGWVSPYVLWPCDDILDLADRWGVEIGDQT